MALGDFVTLVLSYNPTRWRGTTFKPECAFVDDDFKDIRWWIL
jgi:hypothetical protein